MKFLRIELLFLIWGLPLLALVFWYGLRKRRRLLAMFGRLRDHQALLPVETGSRRAVRAVLVLAAALFLVIAAAGPQYGFQWQKIEREGVDIVIALDCSRSMLSEDIQPTRLDRAKREIIDLLGMLQGDRVALTAFSGTAFLQCPLTLDYQAFDLFLNVLTPDYLPVGGTDLSAAVQTALSAFDPQSPADKAIILITDGENTGRGDPMAAAREAQKAGAKLFCIGVGAKEGVPVPALKGGFEKDASGRIVLSRLDETLLSRMALATGGTYVRSVAGDMDLDAIYHDRIRSDLKTATVESSRKQVWADRFQYPLAMAVALFIIALALPLTKRNLAGLFAIAMLISTQAKAQAGPLQQGVDAYKKGDYEQSLKAFIQGQVNDPENPDILYNLGNAYYQNKDYAAAREHYLHALSRLPADPAASQSVDDKAAADAAAPGTTTPRKAAPGTSASEVPQAALKANLHYNLGNTAYRLNELEEAAREYESALKLAPDDAQAKENLAFVRERLKQQQQQQKQQQGDQGQSQQNGEQQQKQDGGQNREQQDGSSQSKAAQNGQQQDQTQDQTQDQSKDADSSGSPEDQSPPPQYGKETDTGQQAAGNHQKQPQAAQPGQASEQKQAEQGQMPTPGTGMLNRLKDEPGRAMMPNYQKRQVEKDW